MSASRLGAGLCVRWVQLYTRRLPEGIGAQRRDEIASDLWDHQQDSLDSGRSSVHHNLDVIGRVLSGIPADLSWRRGIRRSHARPVTGDLMTNHRFQSLADVALVGLAGLGIVTPFPFLILLGTFFVDGVDVASLLWVLGAVALAGVLAAGLALRLRGGHRVLSTVLLVVGSTAPSLAWFWLPPVYLLTVLIAIAALVSSGGRPLVRSAPA